VSARGEPAGIASTLTDETGAFRLGLEEGRFRLTVSADGYAPGQSWVELTADQRRDFTLHPAARIAGRVVRGADRQAVAEALVRIVPEDRSGRGAETKSGADGTFAFGSVAPGAYVVSAAHGRLVGFAEAPVRVGVAEAAAEVIVSLEPAYVIAGVIRDAEGRAVPGATVQMEDATKGADMGSLAGTAVATSDAAGRYRVEGILPGSYRLNAAAPPHAPSESVTVELRTADRTGVDLQLARGGVVKGRAVAHDGRPVIGAKVRVTVREADAMDAPWRGSGKATSAADGSFRIEALGAGRVHVEAQHAREGAVELAPESLEEGEEKALTVRFPKPCSIAGVVRWDDGTPAAAVRVRTYGSGSTRATAYTDEEGAFRVGPLGTGRTMVQAELPHLTWMKTGGIETPDRKAVTLAEGEEKTGVTLVLAKADQTISGVVLGPDGAPLADVVVGAEEGGSRPGRHYLPDRRLHSEKAPATTGADGAFILEGLQKRPYTLFATHARHPMALLEDVQGGTRGVQLRMKAGARLSGVARGADGAPATLFTLTLLPAERPGSISWTSGLQLGQDQQVRHPEGRFAVDALPPGAFDLLVTTPDGRVGRIGGLSLKEGQRREDLVVTLVPAVTLRGRVVDADTGRGLAHVGVGVSGTSEHVHARTDAEGRFVLERQIPGRVLGLSLRIDEGYVPEHRELTVPDQDADLAPFRLIAVPPRGRMSRSDLGLTVSPRGPEPTVLEVAPGSPAARAGLRPGDRLLAIGERNVEGLGPDNVRFLLAGDAGTSVAVKVARGGATRTVELVRTGN
jgi:hypothetical protein